MELLDIDIADKSIFQNETLPLSIANQRNLKNATAKVITRGQSQARTPLCLDKILQGFSKFSFNSLLSFCFLIFAFMRLQQETLFFSHVSMIILIFKHLHSLKNIKTVTVMRLIFAISFEPHFDV